jgi:dTDP-4-amino-4,6-dideoxygalactose transaminase
MHIPFLDLRQMHAEIAGELEPVWRSVLDSGGFIGGELIERFEAAWAGYCGTSRAVGLASGTAALELSLRALDIGPGDEVVLPTNTFIATASAVANVGATPVFVDVDPASLLMTAGDVSAALSPRTAAVIAVHLYGQPADMDALAEVARRAGIAVIEDAAQAHGATWNGRRAGGLSTVGCFSFYPGKNLGAYGDAGAIVTNDAALADRVRSLANHGRAANDAGLHEHRGGNHRLDTLQAAVLLAKLPHLDRWNAQRRAAAERYRRLLADLPVALPAVADGASSSHHLAVIRVPERDAVRRHLAAAGIATGIHYPIPCHRQPAFAEQAERHLPVAEAAAAEILSLPMYPHLPAAAIDRVVEGLSQAVAGRLPDLAEAS